jgi:tripartite-type tricarboxylate transporter receptor subunit TctC
MKQKVKITVLMTLLASFFATDYVSAAAYPTRPIEWYNPWGLGTVTGLVARAVADVAEKQLGGSIQVLPATGGGGVVGAAKVARAKPDGYTLLLCSSAPNAIVFYMNKDVPYRNSDFEFIAELTVTELGLIVGPNSPFKTLEDFIGYARKNPSAVKLATIGIGSTAHLCAEQLKLAGGKLKIDIVPYKTNAEVRTAVMGGHCQAAISYGGIGGTADEFVLVQEGGGKVLAVATKSRLKAFPNVPTMTEKGYDVALSAWYGVAAPKGMPKEISAKLKDAFYKAMRDPHVIAAIEKIGMKPEFRTSEEFTAYIRDYEKVIKRIVEEGNIPRN